MNIFKKYYSIFFIVSTFAFSEHISKEYASDIANRVNTIYNKDKTLEKLMIKNIDTISEHNIDLFYIVNLDPVGFILISADNRAIPLLGYSFDNNFKIDNAPTNINWLINKFKTQISSIINSNIPATESIHQQWNNLLSEIISQETRDVSPLLDAEFDQSGGWNNAVTQAIGFNGPVGCVAVSMAQIMHYWSYPYTGEGSNYYVEDDYGYIEVDFSTAYYDYDNMAATWATAPSQLLLYHAGVSVNMDYENGGSGAWVVGSYPSALYSMENFFSYSNQVYTVWKDNYSTTDFRNILKEQLDNGMPVIYSGYDSSDGGHAWNIDGYSGNNLHCNWGWGGWNNGYYNLTSMGGFSYDQVALIGLIPPALTDPPALFDYEVIDDTVIFIDISQEINESELISWHWVFDDGTSSTTSSGYTEHTYSQPGTYNVQLYVTNEYGQSGPSHYEQIIIEGGTLGDINDDSVANILDIVLIVNFIIGSDTPTTSEFYSADMNDDGILNILDVVILVNTILD